MSAWQLAVAALLGAATAAAAQQPFDLDPSFRTNIQSWYVSSIFPLPNGEVLLSGQIKFPGDNTFRGLAKVDQFGDRVTSFPYAYGGGKLTPWQGRFYVQNGIGMRRIFPDGSVDGEFDMVFAQYLTPLQGGDYHVYPDGQILLSGVYNLHDSTHGFVGHHCLVWLTADGELDTTAHHRTCAGSLDFFTELPNGQFIGSGSTSIWDGQAASNIVRFNADGSLDPSFQANVWWGSAFGFLPLPDGRVYAGGQFRIEGRQDTLNLVRFMPDGSLDPTFNNTLKFLGLNMSAMQHNLGLVRYINPLPNGRIIASGNFDHVGDQQRGCIALLDSSGTLLEDCFTGEGAGIFTSTSGSTSASVGITPAPDGNYYIWGVYNGYDDGTTNDPTQRFVSRLHGLNVGIAEHGAGQPQQLHMAPNPSSGPTTFTTTAPLQKGMLQVHDTSGRLVLDRAWPAGNSSYTLESGALAPGAYVVRVAAGSAARDLAGGYVYAGRLVVLP